MSEEYVYGLRTCSADMTSYGGFQWPRKGWVEAPDWDPSPVCGGGLHFLRNGEGDVGLLSKSNAAVWLVTRSCVNETVDIDAGKSKAKRCEVRFAGDKAKSLVLLRELVGPDKRIPFVCEVAGNRSTQTAGYRSTQTAGYKSTQTAGHRSTQMADDLSTQTARYRSTQTADYGSTQTAGYKSTQTAGDESTQTAGDESTQTAGYKSTQTAGHRSTQTAGDGSTQTAGDNSIQTAGDNSIQRAGEGSVFVTRWWSDAEQRSLMATATVGKDGALKSNVPYRCKAGVWTEVDAQTEADA